jgi:hypothetical protein
MYRATYAHKTAVKLYSQGKSQAEVENMLRAEGAPDDQVDALARTYFEDYQMLRVEAARAKRKRASQFVTIGAVLVGGGVFLSFMTYLLIDNEEGSFVGFYGVIGAGLFALVKGLLDKRQAEAQLQQLP